MKKIVLFSVIVFLLFVSLSFVTKSEKKQDKEKTVEDSFVLIPAGHLKLQRLDDYTDTYVSSLPYELNGHRDPYIKVDSFYMCKYEITNFDYRQFLYSVRITQGDSLYTSMCPDTNVWLRTKVDYNSTTYQNYYDEAYATWYFNHPSYFTYPVVGVAHEQALAYCEWLTMIYNVKPWWSFKKVEFTLPSKMEWEYAAVREGTEEKFPWIGNKLQDEFGIWKANFRQIEQHDIMRSFVEIRNIYDTIVQREFLYCLESYETETDDYLAPVKSFQPGIHGIYNMAGNVEEMVAEKGWTKGGSWNDTGYYLQNEITEVYDSTNSVSAERGFRIIMKVIEY